MHRNILSFNFQYCYHNLITNILSIIIEENYPALCYGRGTENKKYVSCQWYSVCPINGNEIFWLFRVIMDLHLFVNTLNYFILIRRIIYKLENFWKYLRKLYFVIQQSKLIYLQRV